MSFRLATSIDDALDALASGARPIAGGTDLVVGARHGKAPLPDDLIVIEVGSEVVHERKLHIGVVETRREIERSGPRAPHAATAQTIERGVV